MIELPENLTDAEYRALPYESYSSLKYLLESPEAFYFNKNNPFQGNDFSKLGTAVHHLIQGNDSLVTICPVDKRRKKEYDEFIQEYKAKEKHEEAVLLSPSFGDKYEKIKENLCKNKEIKELLEGATFEVPKVKDGKHGLIIKGKIDCITRDNTIVEIKTSSMANTLDLFREEAKERHYDLQAAMYQWLCQEKNIPVEFIDNNHRFIVINTVPPFGCSVYISGKDFIMSGIDKLFKVGLNYNKYIVDKEPWEGVPQIL